MADLIAHNRDEYQAYLARARYLEKRGLLDDAFQDTQAAFRLAPEKADTVLAMAEVAKARKKYTDARTHLQKGLASYPDNAAFYLALARVEMADKKTEAALRCLRRGADLVSARSRTALLHELGVYLIQGGKEEQVKEVLRDLEKGRAPAAVVSDLRAQLL